MRIRDLIQELENLSYEYGDDVEVRIAVQPSWPFEHGISQVVGVDLGEPSREELDMLDPEELEEAELEAARNGDWDPEYVVYLGEGSQYGYLPGNASSALGWR